MLPHMITHETHAGPNLYGGTVISSPDGSLPDIQPTELYDPTKRGDGSHHGPDRRTDRTGRSHDGLTRTRDGPVPVLQGDRQDLGRTGEPQANQGEVARLRSELIRVWDMAGSPEGLAADIYETAGEAISSLAADL